MNAPDFPKAPPQDSPGDPRHLRLLEAILFASAEPVSERALVHQLPEGADIEGLLKELQRHYADRGVNLVRAGRSWAFRTAPDLSQQLNQEIDVPRKLSRAAVETLSIIAYHQPVTRAEIEEIRGVGLSRGTLDVLLEAGWIRPKGRRRTPGRPTTWGTTDGFLDHFGIEDVGDLPGMEELKAAGLLDSGPAINVYQSMAVKQDSDGAGGGAGGGDGGAQLELIENEDDEPEDLADDLADVAADDGNDSGPDDAEDAQPEPLDPDGGPGGDSRGDEAKHA